jgi:hypothetical protein
VLKIKLEEITLKKLEDMKKKAMVKVGYEKDMALFAYEYLTVEYWEYEAVYGGGYDLDYCVETARKHRQKKDEIYKRLNWRSSDEL